MTAVLKLPDFLTVDAFLAWGAPAGLWQLIDGVPQAMALPGPTHALIQGEATALLRNHLVARGSRCSVAVAPGVIPRVQSDTNMRIPDVAVTCSLVPPGEAALREPVLLIEILSPSNREKETWTNVWSYTTIPSVQEILVLHSIAIGADLSRRGADGTWPERPLAVEEGDLMLESIDYTTPVAAFYRPTWLNA